MSLVYQSRPAQIYSTIFPHHAALDGLGQLCVFLDITSIQPKKSKRSSSYSQWRIVRTWSQVLRLHYQVQERNFGIAPTLPKLSSDSSVMAFTVCSIEQLESFRAELIRYYSQLLADVVHMNIFDDFFDPNISPTDYLSPLHLKTSIWYKSGRLHHPHRIPALLTDGFFILLKRDESSVHVTIPLTRTTQVSLQTLHLSNDPSFHYADFGIHISDGLRTRKLCFENADDLQVWYREILLTIDRQAFDLPKCIESLKQSFENLIPVPNDIIIPRRPTLTEMSSWLSNISLMEIRDSFRDRKDRSTTAPSALLPHTSSSDTDVSLIQVESSMFVEEVFTTDPADHVAFHSGYLTVLSIPTTALIEHKSTKATRRDIFTRSTMLVDSVNPASYQCFSELTDDGAMKLFWSADDIVPFCSFSVAGASVGLLDEPTDFFVETSQPLRYHFRAASAAMTQGWIDLILSIARAAQPAMTWTQITPSHAARSNPRFLDQRARPIDPLAAHDFASPSDGVEVMSAAGDLISSTTNNTPLHCLKKPHPSPQPDDPTSAHSHPSPQADPAGALAPVPSSDLVLSASCETIFATPSSPQSGSGDLRRSRGSESSFSELTVEDGLIHVDPPSPHESRRDTGGAPPPASLFVPPLSSSPWLASGIKKKNLLKRTQSVRNVKKARKQLLKKTAWGHSPSLSRDSRPKEGFFLATHSDLVAGLWTEDETFVRIILFTHPTFYSSRSLWNLIVSQFKRTPPSEGASTADFLRIVLHNRVRILGVLHLMIEMGLVPLDLQPNFVRFIQQLGPVTINLLPLITAELMNWAEETLRKSLAAPIAESPPPVYSEFLLYLSIEQIAQCFCVAEFTAFASIPPIEFLLFIDDKNKATHINRFIELFNIKSRWLVSEILRQTSKTECLSLITKLAQVADLCRTWGNFSTVLTISSAIYSPQIYSQRSTLVHLSRDTKLLIKSLSELMSPVDGYKKYRTSLRAIKHPPCIPYLGLILRQLVSIDECHLDTIDGKVNFTKRILFYQAIQDIFKFRNTPFPFTTTVMESHANVLHLLENPPVFNDHDLDMFLVCGPFSET